ncbi:MAG: transglycosylase domain-containing protein [Saprospiraceae bacterium]|nr:transglycosylase domain-containing protein [Saprospiraceae bacterium]
MNHLIDQLAERLKTFWNRFSFTDIYNGAASEDKYWFKSSVAWMWKALMGSILLFLLILFLVSFDNLPTLEELENPKYHNASLVIAKDGSMLGKYYNENREFIPFDSLNPNLLKALLATEDVRFYNHSGVDPWALLRVFFKTILLSKGESGGGSTISQQLAKLLFERPSLKGKGAIVRTALLVRVKFKEWLTAIKLERRYTKEEIISLYLNKFDFIYEAHGVQTAAKTYFGKDQKNLRLDEAAVLIGMLKNPTLYNPRRFIKLAVERRNTVLALVYKDGQISKAEFEAFKKVPLDVSAFKRETHIDGLAPHFRAELGKWLKELFEKDEIRKPNGDKYNPYQDGLKIYVTIDPIIQKAAEDAAKEHMINIQKSYFNVWTKSDPWEYDADEKMKKIRKEALNQLVRETDRFNILWNQHYGKLMMELEAEIGKVDVNDRTIQRLINERRKPGFLKQELKNNQITKTQYDYSTEILKSNQWPEIEKAWPGFEKDLRLQMNTPVSMIVYDYETQADKMVKMSPLDSIKYHRKHLQIGSLSTDPHTGEIKSWVGGVNFKYFKYDHVNSRRQVGSTFKPFVYAAAIALQKISPCNEFQDIQYTIPANDPNFGLPESWSPGNATESFTGGYYNLYNALANSRNSITVKLVMLLGSVNPIRGLLHNMGIDSTSKRRDGGYLIPKFPSIVLGSADLSVYEMTGAYTTFANNGVYVKPYFVSHIEDKNGKVIYRNTPVQNVALAPDYNYVMVDLLMKSGGVSFLKVPAGGKTGTTNNYVDGWFMGITPDLVVGTWVGGEDPWIRFLNMSTGQGAVMARPFFVKFINKLSDLGVSEVNPELRFPYPKGELEIELNCAKFKEMMKSLNMDNSIMPSSGDTDEDEILE